MRRLLFPFLLLLMAPCAQATVHLAASCSSTDVQTKLTAAVAGDTVQIPNGSCTWTSAVTFSNKTIHLTAENQAVPQNVTITFQVNSGIQTGTSNLSRVSYLKLVTETGTSWTNIINVRGRSFRADHNTFEYQSGGPYTRVGIYFNGGIAGVLSPDGVVDNNTFTNMRVVYHGDLGLSGQMTIWNEASTITSPSTTTGVVYVESNTFTVQTPSANNFIDANLGGRYVFRYNTVSNAVLEAHSVQGEHRGTKSWEIYNNTMTAISSVPSHGTFLRGGTGIMFGNTYDTNYVTSPIILDNRRSFTDYSTPPDGCNNTSDWDGNTTVGWPCRDQIGRGPDSSLWSDTSSPYSPAPPSQPSLPAYFFVNTRNGVQVNPSVTNCTSAVKSNGSCADIVSNRDYYAYTSTFDGTSGTGRGTFAARPATCTTGVAYQASNQSDKIYKCTATDTWTELWSAADYPHVLRGEDPAPPPGNPGVALTPAGGTIDFGTVNVGTVATSQNITLTNNGDAALTITSIALTTGTHFSISHNCALTPSTVAASGTCTITVVGFPKSAGMLTDSVVVTSDASTSPDNGAVSVTGKQVILIRRN